VQECTAACWDAPVISMLLCVLTRCQLVMWGTLACVVHVWVGVAASLGMKLFPSSRLGRVLLFVPSFMLYDNDSTTELLGLSLRLICRLHRSCSVMLPANSP
jgi:hypothetical protein